MYVCLIGFHMCEHHQFLTLVIGLHIHALMSPVSFSLVYMFNILTQKFNPVISYS